MCATKDAPRDPFYVHERRHGLAEIVERRVVVDERLRVICPQRERDTIRISNKALRHGESLRAAVSLLRSKRCTFRHAA